MKRDSLEKAMEGGQSLPFSSASHKELVQRDEGSVMEAEYGALNRDFVSRAEVLEVGTEICSENDMLRIP